MKIVILLFCLVSFFASGAEKVLRYSDDGAPTNLDPTQTTSIYESLVLWNLYDTLYSYKYLKRPYELKPQLAESMPAISKDGLTFTIKIKKGVLFADDPAFANGKGREVVAEDFIYSMKRQFDPKNSGRNQGWWRDRIVGFDEWGEKGADYSKTVQGLRALDKYTIQIKLKKPYYQLLYTLAMAQAGVVPREAVEKYGKEFSIHPVGSGPYKLKSFDSNMAVLARNANFRKEKLNLKAEGYSEKAHGYTGIKELDGKEYPFLDRLEIQFMPQVATRWSSFSKGNEIQFSSIPVEQFPNVVASVNPVVLKPDYAAKYHMKSMREVGLVYEFFNMADPRIGYHQDPKEQERNRVLRCAIRKAFDWNSRIKNYFYGMGEAFPGFIPPGIDGFDPNMSRESVTRDVLGAKKMLEKAGWNASNLPVFEWNGVMSVRAKQFFEHYRAWLNEIGYPSEKIKFQSYATWGDFAKAMKEKKAMYVGMGYKLDYPDAENLFALFYGPNASPGANAANYANPKYDELYRKASLLKPSPQRTAIYQKMNQMLVDDCVVITGFSRTYVFLWHKNVLMYPDRDVLGGGFLRYAAVK